MTIELDRAALHTLIEAVGDELPGRWLVVGGAFAALKFSRERTTQDLDIMGLDGTSHERLALMKFANARGLPVETVNSAVEYFVDKVDNWREQVEEIYVGKQGVIYGPSLSLFLELKSARMSEQDLADCEAALAYASQHELRVDTGRLLQTLAQSSAGSAAEARRKQLAQLLRNHR